MSLVKIRDTISPDIARRAAAVADKRPLLAAMGQGIKALSVQAFTDAAKRPAYWQKRKDNKKHALLQLNTHLRKSIRVIGFTSDSVIVGSHSDYAATHQFGRDNIPARPFMPFYRSGQISNLGRRQVERVLLAALRARGL